MSTRPFVRVAAALAAALIASPSLAADEATEEGETFIEEIIVTAEKREESILEVPLTMSAFSEQMIEETGMTNNADLEQLVPGLQFGDDHGTSIRGIISQLRWEGHTDLAVAVYVNGVYTVDAYGIAPWREWDLGSRESLMAYAAAHGIPIERKRGTESPFSMDANMLHISYEGGPLEDPWYEPPAEMWLWSVSPQHAPNEPTYVDLTFAGGDIVAVDGQPMTPGQVLATLNALGAANGVGRVDIVENRYVGMKSRGAYETPGGTIMLRAHRAIESITLDREMAHLKDEIMPRYAELIYNGYWWSPERSMLQTAIDYSQGSVNGEVRVRLYKGNVDIAGRRSEESLFDYKVVTFDEDEGAYNQADATGFIALNALRLRNLALKQAGKGG